MSNFFDFSISRLSRLPHGVRFLRQNAIEDLIDMDPFPRAMSSLVRSKLLTRERAPGASAFFTTRQRRLFFHAVLALYFQKKARCPITSPGLAELDFRYLAFEYGLASQDSVDAFLEDALRLDVIVLSDEKGDDGVVEVLPSPAMLEALTLWYEAYFRALDVIDGGKRAATFLAETDAMLTRLQPFVARALLPNFEVVLPRSLSAVFAGAEADEEIMETLIAGIDWEKSQGQDILLADSTAIANIAQSSELSRFHVARKFVAAELIGGLGWTGRRGRSPLWISSDFYREYARLQAYKLCILHEAFAEASAHQPPAEADEKTFDADLPFGFPDFKNGVIGRPYSPNADSLRVATV